MPFPHGSDCRCPSPGLDGGLLQYTVDCDHYQDLAEALARIADQPATARLRVLTTDPRPPSNLVPIRDTEPCDGSMLCHCAACEKERADRVKYGVKQPRQPWDAVRKAA